MNTTEQQAKQEIVQLIPAPLAADLAMNEFREKLAAFINGLINTDFNYLIHLLYRLDVAEKKLKTLLRDAAGTDAGWLIADLIISRQIEKINTRQQFRSDTTHIPDEDKW